MGSLFFDHHLWSIFLDINFVNITQIWCQMVPPHKIFLFLSPLLLRLLLLWLTQGGRMFPFSSVLTSTKWFLSIWIEKDFWRQRDLNPHLSDQIHDELDHTTPRSCKKKHWLIIRMRRFMASIFDNNLVDKIFRIRAIFWVSCWKVIFKNMLTLWSG